MLYVFCKEYLIHDVLPCSMKCSNRLRDRVVKGVGHLDHVRSYGVREVVSSIPDRGNKYSRMSFSSDQVTGTVSSSEHAFPTKF